VEAKRCAGGVLVARGDELRRHLGISVGAASGQVHEQSRYPRLADEPLHIASSALLVSAAPKTYIRPLASASPPLLLATHQSPAIEEWEEESD
jgi:hypothetical protein